MDKNKPLVSICCQTYNHKDYISTAIDSFLMQKTNFKFEILLRDDASNDGTAEICKVYASKHPDIINLLAYNENQWQKGVSPFPDNVTRAKGKYIALCEGDDYWTDPLKLQKQVDFLEENEDYVLTGHDAKIIDKNGQLLKNTKLNNEFKKDASSEELKKAFWVLTLSMVFRNLPFLKDYPKESYNVTNGDTFLLSLLGKFGASHYMPEIEPAGYRIHGGGMWSSSDYFSKLKSSRNTFLNLHHYYKRIKEEEMAFYYYQKRIKQSDSYLSHSLNKKTGSNFYKAYVMYFKDYKVYKNPREFIYLHKTVLRYFFK